MVVVYKNVRTYQKRHRLRDPEVVAQYTPERLMARPSPACAAASVAGAACPLLL